MKQMNLEGEELRFLIDDDGHKRPIPPKRFKKYKPDIKRKDNGSRQRLCPVCGCPWHESGENKGWVDNGAQEKFDEETKKKGSFDALCVKYEGKMLKRHWSRYSTKLCLHCGVEIWHDMISNDYNFYYDPSTADKSIGQWEEKEKELRPDGGVKNE